MSADGRTVLGPDARHHVRAPGPGATARIREVAAFLVVGGVAYVVDVAVFNLLLARPGPTSDPKLAKALSVTVAMTITYLGNLTWTWRGARRRQGPGRILLFVLVNLAGMGFSVACLAVSHDLLGLTSTLADNVSANVVGLLMGTAFRYWAYRRLVFSAPTLRE